jgi:hypothetical protein
MFRKGAKISFYYLNAQLLSKNFGDCLPTVEIIIYLLHDFIGFPDIGRNRERYYLDRTV